MTARVRGGNHITTNLGWAITAVLLVFPFDCQSIEPRSIDRSIDPITVSGPEASTLFGMEISNIRAMVSRNGKIYPIPFQIDQKDSNNDWVWDSVTYKGEEPGIPEHPYDDQDPVNKRIFDENDVIVLMVKDAGDKDRDGIMRTSADKLIEVEITDAIDNQRGWVYITYYDSNAPALSNVRYVHYDPKNHLVTATNHEFEYSPDHIMVLEDVRIDGASIIERNSIRGEVSVGFGPFPISFEFNEESFKGYTYGHIEGPVRVIKRSIENVELRMGISSPPANCDHYHYPWHAETPILISKRPPVRRVSFLTTSVLQPGTINRTNTGTSWISFGGDGFSVANGIKIPEEHKNHIDISSYATGIDEISEPQNIIHHSEFEAGFEISTNEQTPDGDHIVHSVIVFFSDPKLDDQSGRAIEMLDNPLILKTYALRQ